MPQLNIEGFMNYFTMRLLFPRDAVLSLLDEPAFEYANSLTAQRDVKPFSDVYLAVFVLEAEPVPGCVCDCIRFRARWSASQELQVNA
jgi:hypothetical protein